jgi:hypothetical protein
MPHGLFGTARIIENVMIPQLAEMVERNEKQGGNEA